MKLFLFILIVPIFCTAQVVNTGMTANYDSLEVGKVKIGGFVDTYYGYDFNEPTTYDRPYSVSSSRHNEININLAYIEVQYINERVRGRLVPGFGTYINANYVNEKGSLKNLIEANVGVRLSEKRDIWVDAGILGSPYTNETAISKDHAMYTRSFAPEFVPYYLAGAKLSVPIKKKLKAYAYILNGWQVINDVNNPLSIGTQLEYRPNNKLLFNWDTYVGDESSQVTPENRTRYFTDVYVIYDSPKKLDFSTCAYIGVQDRKDSLGIKSQAIWWQANIIANYSFKPTLSLAGRIEYFNDMKSVQIIPITSLTGFNAGSASLCLNVKIGRNAMFRLEGRSYFSDRNMFIDKHGAESNQDHLLITSLAVWF